MKLIVGLGNPGEKYSYTRHNVGFIYLDTLAEKYSQKWTMEDKFKAEIAKINHEGVDYVLAKPQTFMNDSGESVAKLVNFFKIDLTNLIVVHDDVDLDRNSVKLKKDSGTAGHNGVIDISLKLNSSNYWRLRVGVGRPENNKFEVFDWVLGELNDDEVEKIRSLVTQFDLFSQTN